MAGTGLASHTAAACALLVVIAPLQHLQQLADVHLGWCRQRSGNMPGSVSVP